MVQGFLKMWHSFKTQWRWCKASCQVAALFLCGASLLLSPIQVLADSASSPTFKVDDASVIEGQMLSFSVGLLKAETEHAYFEYVTSDGTAKESEGDYQSRSGNFVLPPGNRYTNVSVQTTPNTLVQTDRTFTLTVYRTLADGTRIPFDEQVATGTIIDDDPGPVHILRVTSPMPDGTYGVGANIDIDVVFSGPVTRSGGATLKLDVTRPSSASVYASAVGSPDPNTLRFRYIVEAKDQAPNLDYSPYAPQFTQPVFIRDANGYRVNETFPAPRSSDSLAGMTDITVDGFAPVIASIDLPVRGTYRVGDTLSFNLRISKPVTVTLGQENPVLFFQLNGVSRSAIHTTTGTLGNTLRFDYTIQPGDSDPLVYSGFDLQGASLKDSTGRDLAKSSLVVAANAGVFIDTSPYITFDHLNVTGASGPDGTYIVGDVVTATWNADANGFSGATSVTVDFSEFGGGSTVAATEQNGIWTAKYRLEEGTIDASGRNITFTAIHDGITMKRTHPTKARVDLIPPKVNLIFNRKAVHSSQPLEVGITTNQPITGLSLSSFYISHNLVDVSYRNSPDRLELDVSRVPHGDTVTIDFAPYSIVDINGNRATTSTPTIQFRIDNLAPVHSVPNRQSTTMSDPLVLENGSAISVADDTNVTTVLSVSGGHLVVNTAGAAVIDGNLTSTLTLSGSASEVSQALNGLTYHADGAGEQTLSISSIDNAGNTATDTLKIDVIPRVLLVTTVQDTGSDFYFAATLEEDRLDGDGLSLREALHWAGNDDEITFDLDSATSGNQGGTIELSGGALPIAVQGLTINGDLDDNGTPDVSIKVVDGNHAIDISTGAKRITLNGLSITGAVESAIYLGSGSEVTLRNSLISQNGGGLSGDGYSALVINTTISGNESSSLRGGAISVATGGDISVINSTFSANKTLDHGGAIYFDGNELTLINTTISGNYAGGIHSGGGGIYLESGTLDIHSSTIVGNAANSSGGIHIMAGGIANIFNSVVAGNQRGEAAAPGVSGSPLASGGDPSDVSGWFRTALYSYFGGSVNISDDSLGTRSGQGVGSLHLGDLAYNFRGTVQTHRPSFNSALVGAGEASLLPPDEWDLDANNLKGDGLPVDANGRPRVYAKLDIGAVELSNSAPLVSTAGAPTTIDQGSLYDFTPTYSDNEDDALIFSGDNLPTWLTIDSSTGRISGTPGNGDVGTTSSQIHIKVSDDGGSSWHYAESAFSITVVNINDAPVVVHPVSDQTVNQDQLFSLTLPADMFIDVDAGDVLTYSVTLANGNPIPSWLSFNSATLTLSGTPTNSHVGSFDLVVTASDGEAMVSDTFTLTVVNVNDWPTLNTPVTNQTVYQDQPFSLILPSDMFIDVDAGDVLTYSVTLANGDSIPSWLNFNSATLTLSGTPTNSHVGSFDLKVTVSDGEAVASTTFVLTVFNVNDKPTVANGIPNQNVNQGELFNFTFDANTFTDIDVGDVLSYSATLAGGAVLPSWLSFNSTTRTFSGTPTNDDVGSLIIHVTASDGTVMSDSATFTLTVVNVNDKPTVANGIPNQNVNQGELFNFTFDANTFTDIDVGDVLSYSATLAGGAVLPSWLSFNSTTRTFSGTPTNDDVGSLIIHVTASDGTVMSDSATFTLTVVNVNDKPTVANGIPNQNVNQGELFNFTFDANTFTDIDVGDVLSYSATLAGGAVLPSWLSFNSTTRTFSGTPTNDDVGSLIIHVTASDGTVMSDSATFTLTVVNVNDKPTVANGIPNQNVNQGELFNFTFDANTFTDIDVGDVLSYSATLAGGAVLPSWLSFNSTTRTFSGTPENDDVGAITIRVTATDTTNESVFSDFVLNVVDLNDAPTVENTIADQLATQDAAFAFTFGADVFADVDPQDVLIYSSHLLNIEPLPQWLSFDSASRTFSGTPTNDDVGALVIEIVARDGAGLEAATSFNLVVENVNDAPTISGPPVTRVDQEEAYYFKPTVEDIDGDTLSFKLSNHPSWMSVNAVGEITGTPQYADVGLHSDIRITVSDGELEASLIFSVEVLFVYDPQAPILTAPRDVTLNAKGNFTAIDLKTLLGLPESATQSEIESAIKGLATDYTLKDDCCTTRVDQLNVEGVLMLRSGRHELTWTTTNSLGKTDSATQVVNINPLVSISAASQVSRDSIVNIPVLLHGDAPYYPYEVNFIVDPATTASSDEHNLVDGVITFKKAGEYLSNIPVALSPLVGLTDSDLIVRLTDSNPSANATHKMTITEGNIAPKVKLVIEQNGATTTMLGANLGAVKIVAQVQDANINDVHQFDWSETLLTDVDSNLSDDQFIFDPEGVVGVHTIHVDVTDSAGALVTGIAHIRVFEQVPLLSNTADTNANGILDADEGVDDSNGNGIPDYLDRALLANTLPYSGDIDDPVMLECEFGVSCSLGAFSFELNGSGVEITQPLAGKMSDDSEYEHVGTLVDFIVRDLPNVGGVARVALPQRQPIPAGAVYRKYHEGNWHSFVEGAHDQLHSAISPLLGYCPAPGGDDWLPGLVEGATCVQLTLSDGGANDADGRPNRVIVDPGVIAVKKAVVPEPEPPTPQEPPVVKVSGKSGGSMSLGVIAIMLSLFAVIRLCRMRQKSLAAMIFGAMAFTASNVGASGFYLDINYVEAKGSDTRGSLKRSLEREGFDVQVIAFDNSHRDIRPVIGYAFTVNHAIEVGYLDLGGAHAEVSAPTFNPQGFTREFAKRYPQSAEGMTISYRGSLPLDKNWRASLELGLYRWESESDINEQIFSRQGTDALVGVRLDYTFNDQWQLGVQQSRIYLSRQDANLLSVGVRHKF
ncbi:MAG: putative Ig domain-containing protein [Cellvibrio sp.]